MPVNTGAKDLSTLRLKRSYRYLAHVGIGFGGQANFQRCALNAATATRGDSDNHVRPHWLSTLRLKRSYRYKSHRANCIQ